MTDDTAEGPSLEFFEDLEVDGGDYRIVLTVVVRGRHEVHVSRFSIEPKDPTRHTVAADTLRGAAKGLQSAAETALARHQSTSVNPLGDGVLVLGSGDNPWTGAVRNARIVHVDAQNQANLQRLYAARRRAKLTDADLELVAETVRNAQAAGEPIQAAVAAVMAVSESRAGHLIKMARDRGVLERSPRAQG